MEEKCHQTWGVPLEEIEKGIKNGVRKINIDTDCRMAMTGAIRKILIEKPNEFDPRKYLAPAMNAMKEVCSDRLKDLELKVWLQKLKFLHLIKWPINTFDLKIITFLF